MEEGKRYDIKERCLKFAVRIVSFVDNLPKTIAGYKIGGQLLGAGTSVGANVEEADGAVSRKDFINKTGIARKEARESNYWLRVIDLSNLLKKQDVKTNGEKIPMTKSQISIRELQWLLNESEELRKILSSIIDKAKKNQ